MRETADKILAIRNKKYPPTMKCAGSIFKNFLLADLPARVVNEIPPNVIIEGKVPSAWFLEQVGAKGMRAGDIHVADYHANLIYNGGQGTARDLVAIIAELKQRVERRWGIPLEEEVQYVGFPATAGMSMRSCHNLKRMRIQVPTRSGRSSRIAASLAWLPTCRPARVCCSALSTAAAARKPMRKRRTCR